MIKKDDLDYIFEEYKGHTIASHRNNVAEKDINNLIIVYRTEDFPEYGFIVGLDDSKLSGRRKSFPHNMEDAKSYIDWVVDVRQQKEAGKTEREKPTVFIEGTEFIVDGLKDELREKSNPRNVMHIKEMQYVGNGNGYTFHYDVSTKNFPTNERRRELAFTDSTDLQLVQIPELTSIDPIGVAQKYNLSLEEVKGKIDFGLTIEKGSLLDLRWNKGVLPTLDIEGHTFYVDIQMDMLRPKDDFRSKGIVFSEIEKFYDHDTQRYFIPYHPKAHEFRDIDYESITQIPKDLMVVSFPNEAILDPVGWNKKHGFDLIDEMKEPGLRMNFKAVPETWEHIYVPERIKENLDKLQKESKKEKPDRTVDKSRKRGRKM
ncbi:hypothetical protein WJU16_03465 [Chitinophaga pollutisoli]|uniref:Schlafen AlbA-2 domain-containing protein n=1 Tax=Chitinophaga pollutisoli TaxID=3133966 RepID=A0ABZ2YRH0_9BACT